MIYEKNFDRTLFVPLNYEKKVIPVTMKISETSKSDLDEICMLEDRHLSYVARELMLRGLALYRLDGRLKDDMRPGVTATTNTVQKEPSKKPLAPVVARIEPGPEVLLKNEIRRTINAAEIDEIEKRLKPRRKKAG